MESFRDHRNNSSLPHLVLDLTEKGTDGNEMAKDQNPSSTDKVALKQTGFVAGSGFLSELSPPTKQRRQREAAMAILQGKTLKIHSGPVIFLLGEGQTHHPVPLSVSLSFLGRQSKRKMRKEQEG